MKPCRLATPFLQTLARTWLLLLLLPACVHAFDFNDIALRAHRLATGPYVRPVKNLSGPMANLDYDQYRDIRFDPAKST